MAKRDLQSGLKCEKTLRNGRKTEIEARQTGQGRRQPAAEPRKPETEDRETLWQVRNRRALSGNEAGWTRSVSFQGIGWRAQGVISPVSLHPGATGPRAKVPQGRWKIARRFIAGIEAGREASPAGTTELLGLRAHEESCAQTQR